MGLIARITEKLIINKEKIQREKFLEINIPILVIDGAWHEVMGNGRKTVKIASLEKKLTRLLKEQGKLNSDIKGYTNIKKDMVNKIISLTPDVFDENSEDAKDQMSKSQKYIIDINDKFDTIEKRLTDVEEEIYDTNHELFYESVKMLYSELSESKMHLQIAESQIEKLRAMLKAKVDEKAKHEELVQSTYSYLHKMLGPKFSNVLDAEFENE